MSTPEILEALVGFDTTSRRSNLPLIDWVRTYLDRQGVSYRLTHDETGEKANLHAIIGPQVEGGLALSGHVDTVPVDGQAWSTDPFRLTGKDGKLYARGAVDMKGFVASCLAAVPDLKALPLQRPVHLFISYNEEVDCAGARVLVRDLEAGRLRPAVCVVGEPSGMKPITAHKGRLSVRVTVRGRPGHSSVPANGVNAIHAGAEAIAWIAAEARRLQAEGRREDGFDPPHSTIHTGLVEGGSILNIIPGRASFEMEWRTIPGDDAEVELARLQRHAREAIESWMHRVDPATGFTFEPLDTLPPLSLSPEHALVALVKQASGANHHGKVSYGTEAGIFQNAGIASIVCGPGDIAQAHQPDEWIARDQLVACDSFIRRLGSSLTRDASLTPEASLARDT
ncbi:acetylornithine deacetylase [Lichenicoccus sp.]|uniref:acetylornithine deacetylase n=1 Tax=Lichenicoccus sp. TaxID=2781899 RepID=UPI003D12E3B1